jgi:hypothetical protein
MLMMCVSRFLLAYSFVTGHPSPLPVPSKARGTLVENLPQEGMSTLSDEQYFFFFSLYLTGRILHRLDLSVAIE